MVYCSKCGRLNNNSVTSCRSCGSTLIKEEYLNLKSFNSFEELFVDETFDMLKSASISEDEYNMIIKNIIDFGDFSLDELYEDIPLNKRENFDILTKVSFIATAFAKIKYKTKGAELGSYAFNCINIDDRLDNSNQISALIHELSHHLLAEIFEQVLMYVLEVNKTNELESFSHLSLMNSPSALMDEYCAHTVQGRFIPHGYQNYGSFNILLNKNFDSDNDQDVVYLNMVLGNSFAEDIIKIIEHFIDYDLREEIKAQFKKDYTYPPKYDEILLEYKTVMPCEDKIHCMFELFKLTFELTKNKETSDLLDYLNKNYEEYNKY